MRAGRDPRHAAAISNRVVTRRRGLALAWGRLHARLYRASGGRLFGRWMGAPVIVIETVGRRSGTKRATPILGMREGDAFVVMAANAGSERTPAWWLNLRDAGSGTVVFAGRRQAVRPRLPEGEERELLWSQFVAMHPAAEHYGSFTERELPLVVLEPIGSAFTRGGGGASE